MTRLNITQRTIVLLSADMKPMIFVILSVLSFALPAHKPWLDGAADGYSLRPEHRGSDHSGLGVLAYPAVAAGGACCVDTAALENTSEGDLVSLGPVDEAPLLVSLDHAALAGPALTCDGQSCRGTGNDGPITCRVSHGGVRSIRARLSSPLGDGKADRLIRTGLWRFGRDGQ